MAKVLAQVRVLFVTAAVLAAVVMVAVVGCARIHHRQLDPDYLLGLLGVLIGVLGIVLTMWQRLASVAPVEEGQIDKKAVRTAWFGMWVFVIAAAAFILAAVCLGGSMRLVALGLALSYLSFAVSGYFFACDLRDKLPAA